MRAGDTWTVREKDLSETTAPGHETVFAQANGYRCLRGSSPFLQARIPGNFFAGVYDRSEAPVTELVNAPDPLPVTLYLDYEPLRVGRPACVSYERSYDLESATVTTEAVFRAATGSELAVRVDRFVSHARRARWGERWTLTARNFSRRVLFAHSIDGGILSSAGHPLDATKHFRVEALGGEAIPGTQGSVWLRAKTRDHGMTLVEAQTMAGGHGLKLLKVRELAERVEAVWELPLEAGISVELFRLGASSCSRPGPLHGLDAAEELERFLNEGWESEYGNHRAALAALWRRIDIGIDGDERAQRGLRFNLLQLASCADPDDTTVSIGAKGLHGEGYKGHVFWDTEIFMLPFFAFTQPGIARNLLRYRCHTLGGARSNAAASGMRGARFAWESADDGIETTPRWGVDYAGNQVRIWSGDLEAHIDADITYAVLKYVSSSGDEDFLREGGLRLLFEIAVFWCSFAVYDEKKARYEIRDVIGPDEFHEHVDNNSYTNYLVKWALLRTLELAAAMGKGEPALLESVMAESGVADADLELWERVAGRMYLPGDERTGLIEQFEGYFALKEHPIAERDRNGMPRWPTGLDLARLGETTLIKQPDVVMLFALLPEEFDEETKRRNYEFYEARTMHKSSLSPSIYAMVGMSLGKHEHAYDYFLKALETDLVDNQGNNAWGIHSANMGGVWQTAVFGFGGLSSGSDGVPRLRPWLPPQWTGLRYRFIWRGTGVDVAVDPDGVTVRCDRKLSLEVWGRNIVCEAGTDRRVDAQ